MERMGQMQNSKSSWKQYFAFGVICVVIFAYTFYHIASLFSEDMETFAVGVTTETRTVGAGGYVFRNETVLYSENGGVVDYRFENGTKVSQGQALADVYQTGGQQSRRQIAFMDDRISVLEGCENTSSSNTDIASLQDTVDDSYYILVNMLASGETGELSLHIRKLLSDMDKLSILIDGEDSPVLQTLSELRESRSEMLNSGGGVITEYAGEGGYFYTSCDGYEDRFTLDMASNMSGDDFYELITSGRTPSVSDGRTAYGKIAENSVWYFALPVTEKESMSFEKGESYTVEFTENNGQKLPMTLERSISSVSYGSMILIFSCDRLPDNFAFYRSQSVRIEISSVSGLYVPKSAVERVDGMRGVYILRGSVVHFRYLEVRYEGSDYFLAVLDAPNEEDRLYLRENDLVILNGNHLFEGRILD